MDDKQIAALPSNSKRSREGPEQKTVEREKVVTGAVIQRKKGFWKNLKEIGFNGMFRTLMDTAGDILEFVGMIGDGIDMLRGERPRGRGTGNRPRYGEPRSPYVSYNRVQDDRQRQDTRREMSRTGRARHDFDEVEFEDRNEAELVLFNLNDSIRDYGHATVADFYQFSGIRTSHVDYEWGWTSLDGVRPVRIRGGGFIIDLPRAILIN